MKDFGKKKFRRKTFCAELIFCHRLYKIQLDSFGLASVSESTGKVTRHSYQCYTEDIMGKGGVWYADNISHLSIVSQKSAQLPSSPQAHVLGQIMWILLFITVVYNSEWNLPKMRKIHTLKRITYVIGIIQIPPALRICSLFVNMLWRYSILTFSIIVLV